MIWALGLGTAAYLLMMLSDWWTAIWKKRGGSIWFYSGCGGLVAALWLSLPGISLNQWRNEPFRMICATICVIWVVLLLYTVLIAPFLGKNSGFCETGKQPLANTGVYALCRHPGGLWFGLSCLFLWLSVGGFGLLAAGIWLTLLDVLYVWWQDRLIFPRTISRYTDYQRTTPFLLPNRQSLRRCWESIWKKKDGQKGSWL